MQRHELTSPPTPHRNEHPCEDASTTTKGRADRETQAIEVQEQLKYLRNELDAVRDEMTSIKHRLAYSAGGAIVVLGLLGWIGNSRFDQVVALLMAP